MNAVAASPWTVVLRFCVFSVEAVRRRVPFALPSAAALTVLVLLLGPVLGAVSSTWLPGALAGALSLVPERADGVRLLHLLLFAWTLVTATLAITSVSPTAARARYFGALPLPRWVLAVGVSFPCLLLLTVQLSALAPSFALAQLRLSGAGGDTTAAVVACSGVALAGFLGALWIYGACARLRRIVPGTTVSVPSLAGVLAVATTGTMFPLWNATVTGARPGPVVQALASVQVWALFERIVERTGGVTTTVLTVAATVVVLLLIGISLPLCLMPCERLGVGRFGGPVGLLLARHPSLIYLLRAWRLPRLREFHHAAWAMIALVAVAAPRLGDAASRDALAQNGVYLCTVFAATSAALCGATMRVRPSSYETVLGYPARTARLHAALTALLLSVGRHGIACAILLAAVGRLSPGNLALYAVGALATASAGYLLGLTTMPEGRFRLPADGLLVVAGGAAALAFSSLTDISGIAVGGWNQFAIAVAIAAGAVAVAGRITWAQRLTGRHRVHGKGCV